MSFFCSDEEREHPIFAHGTSTYIPMSHVPTLVSMEMRLPYKQRECIEQEEPRGKDWARAAPAQRGVPWAPRQSRVGRTDQSKTRSTSDSVSEVSRKGREIQRVPWTLGSFLLLLLTERSGDSAVWSSGWRNNWRHLFSSVVVLVPCEASLIVWLWGEIDRYNGVMTS